MAANVETAEVEIVLSNGKKAGQTINDLTGTVVKLNREVKNLTPGTAEFETKTKDLQKVQKRLNDVRKEVRGVEEASEALKGQFAGIIPFSSQFSALGGTLGNVTTVLGGTTKAAKLFRLALAATGIGAIVVVFGSLISYLTSTQAGMDKVTSVTRPLMAIFEKMKGVVQELGGSVFKGLGQILNGDITKGLKSLGSGFKESINNTKEAIKGGAEAGKQLDQLTKQIEKSEIALASSRERLNRKFEEQKFIAEDSTKTEKERVAAAQAAMAAQDELLNMEQSILDLRTKKLKVEQSLNDTSREGHLEMAQFVGEGDKLEAQALAKKKEARNQQNSILQQGVAKEKAAADAITKAKQDAAQKELAYKRSIENLTIELIEDTTEREIAQITLDTQRKIEALTGSEEQIAAQRLALQQLADQQIKDYKKEQEEIQAAEDEEKAALKHEDWLLDEEVKKIRLQESFDNLLITEAQFQEAIYQQEKLALERKLALVTGTSQAELIEKKKISNSLLQLDIDRNSQIVDNAEKTAEAKKNIEQMGLQAAIDVLGTTVGLLKEESMARKVAGNALKAFTLGKIAIDLQSEIQAIWTTANASPTNILFPGSGNLIAGLKTAMAVARAVSAGTQVAKQKFSFGGRLKDSMMYARGFLPKGPSHDQGGIKMIDSQTGAQVGEMEGDEPILTKGVGRSAELRSMVNYVNQKAGGRRIYAAGGIPSMPAPINPLSSAGQDANSLAQALQNQEGARQPATQQSNEGNEQLIQEFRILSAKVDTWQRTLKVVNDPRETFDAKSNIKQVENDASF